MGVSNSVEREIKKTLSKASREGDIETLSETLKAKEAICLINEYGPKGHTPLYEAASSNQVEAARLLIKHGAKVNIQDQNNGWTALHAACKKNCYDMVKLLLEVNEIELNITTRDELKQTPLHLAAHLCSKEIVKCLLDHGANKLITDTFGSTPDKWTKNPDIKTLILNHVKDKSSAQTPIDSSNMLNGKYEILERIGKGGFGVVYKVRVAQSGIGEDVRAVKVVTFEDEMEMENANREATAMLSLDNPYVLKTYEIFKYEPCKGLCFCMEYYSHGDLDTYIRKKITGTSAPKQIVFAVFYQMAKALSYLHERRLIHRDIKPQNIFVKNLNDEKVINIVLGDFGLSKQIDNTQNQTKAGTLLFMSPEVFSNEPYGLKADIWSLGVVLYQLMTREMDTNICAQLLTKGASGIQTVKEKLSQKGYYPPQLVDLVMQTLSVDHEQRPSSADLCTNLLNIKDTCDSEGFSFKALLNGDE